MAAQNRTDLTATKDALAAVVDLAELKAVLANMIDSGLLKRDVKNTITVASAGTTNVDFANYDVIEVDTIYDVTLNLQNIVDGDIKFLHVNKTATTEVLFTGGTDQTLDKSLVTLTHTDDVYMVYKKSFSGVIIFPMFKDAVLSYSRAAIDTITGGLSQKVLNIGVWNMDSTSVAVIAHGLTPANIRSFDTIIINDAGVSRYHISEGGNIYLADTEFRLERTTSGFFDNTNFNDGTMNRGFIVVHYTT